MAISYKYYMSRLIDGTWTDDIDLEEYFPGMKYVSCTGLSNYGKIKNIYTESYAETEELRVYIPSEIVRENTEIEFEFGFEKAYRRETYDNFVKWISGYKLKYWDTARYREVEMILTEALEVDEDLLYGSAPFLVVPFTFTNLKGSTTAKEYTSIATDS